MKVLLVDDEEDIRKIAALSLRSVGKFEVLLAESAAVGLALAKREQPDVILLDMMMPGMDGVAAIGALRKDPDTSHIPVVFMTAKVQRAEIEQFIMLGALGVIHKPFDPMTMPGELLGLLQRA